MSEEWGDALTDYAAKAYDQGYADAIRDSQVNAKRLCDAINKIDRAYGRANIRDILCDTEIPYWIARARILTGTDRNG